MRSENNPSHRRTREGFINGRHNTFLDDFDNDEEEDPDTDYDNLYVSDIGGMNTLIAH